MKTKTVLATILALLVGANQPRAQDTGTTLPGFSFVARNAVAEVDFFYSHKCFYGPVTFSGKATAEPGNNYVLSVSCVPIFLEKPTTEYHAIPKGKFAIKFARKSKWGYRLVVGRRNVGELKGRVK